VADADRRHALLAARDNAVHRLIESLKPIELPGGKTLGQALADSKANKELEHWLMGRPVKSVDFGDDLIVHLTLDVTADSLWPVLRSVLTHQKDVPPPATEAQWAKLGAEVATHLADATGTGVIQPNAPPAVGNNINLPAQPPDWTNRLAEAEATSNNHGGRLHTSRNAEDLALEKLRRQIEDLPLSPGTTLAAAAQHDPRIEKAITKAMRRAKPVEVSYGKNGSATVRVALQLSDLWAELTGQ
jgi:hypothetical protein